MFSIGPPAKRKGVKGPKIRYDEDLGIPDDLARPGDTLTLRAHMIR